MCLLGRRATRKSRGWSNPWRTIGTLMSSESQSTGKVSEALSAIGCKMIGLLMAYEIWHSLFVFDRNGTARLPIDRQESNGPLNMQRKATVWQVCDLRRSFQRHLADLGQLQALQHAWVRCLQNLWKDGKDRQKIGAKVQSGTRSSTTSCSSTAWWLEEAQCD